MKKWCKDQMTSFCFTAFRETTRFQGKYFKPRYPSKHLNVNAAKVVTPSPCSQHTYKSYIQHQIKMLTKGIAAYATRKYARLLLDKYIQSNRESDNSAVKLTKGKPKMFCLSNAELAPNLPIEIRQGKRCP